MPLTATSNFSGSGCSSPNEPRPPDAAPWELFDSGRLSWRECASAQQESIVRHFAPKVRYLALRLKNRLPRAVELADLIGAGILGLMESFDKFRPCLGVRFDTYVETRIQGAMLDELRRLDWFPRPLRQRVRLLEAAQLRLELEWGRSPTDEELALETGLALPDVREGLEAARNQYFLPLDLLGDTLGEPTADRREEPFAATAARELADRLAGLIERLTPREQLVLSLYYTEELNMREAAEVMGITEGRVSQLHSQALRRLRREFAAMREETL
jgi:RNA polymerase sigma factor for flagellar operon FliA